MTAAGIVAMIGEPAIRRRLQEQRGRCTLANDKRRERDDDSKCEHVAHILVSWPLTQSLQIGEHVVHVRIGVFSELVKVSCERILDCKLCFGCLPRTPGSRLVIDYN